MKGNGVVVFRIILKVGLSSERRRVVVVNWIRMIIYLFFDIVVIMYVFMDIVSFCRIMLSIELNCYFGYLFIMRIVIFF